MIKGNCLCGKVSYEIHGRIGYITHCQTCRKAHGSAFSSVAPVRDVDFSLKGEEHLNSYESSKGKHRYFCSSCGTQVYAKREDKDHVILRLGSLNDDPGSKEWGHIWVSSKASWYQIKNDLPEHAEQPDHL